MEQSSERPSTALRRLVNGYQVSQAIHVAATLGIADLLAAGPRASDDLAAATGAHPQALYRLLRALASVGVFHEEEGRCFSLTPLGDCLRADAPEPVGGWAAFVGRPYVWRAWGELLHAVTAGEVAFAHVHGTDAWAYRASHPDENAIFDRAMTANSRRQAEAILAAYDFARFRRIVDVGGGRGALLAAILARHPEGRGVLFDQSHVVADAGPVLAAAGVAGRCEVVGGDFFRSVPAGGDAYVLRAILHDWGDGDATAILRTVRGAMAPEARLLLIERIVAPPNTGADTKFSDLNMLVELGGRERTREEYGALCAAAGFRAMGAIGTAAEHSIVEAVPA